jgi:hypothetical protein
MSSGRRVSSGGWGSAAMRGRTVRRETARKKAVLLNIAVGG